MSLLNTGFKIGNHQQMRTQYLLVDRIVEAKAMTIGHTIANTTIANVQSATQGGALTVFGGVGVAGSIVGGQTISAPVISTSRLFVNGAELTSVGGGTTLTPVTIASFAVGPQVNVSSVTATISQRETYVGGTYARLYASLTCVPSAVGSLTRFAFAIPGGPPVMTPADVIAVGSAVADPAAAYVPDLMLAVVSNAIQVQFTSQSTQNHFLSVDILYRA